VTRSSTDLLHDRRGRLRVGSRKGSAAWDVRSEDGDKPASVRGRIRKMAPRESMPSAASGCGSVTGRRQQRDRRFFQLGINDSARCSSTSTAGVRLTGFGWSRRPGIPWRGRAASWLNEKRGFRSNEVSSSPITRCILVGAHLCQPKPDPRANPGANRRLSPAPAVTMRVTVWF